MPLPDRPSEPWLTKLTPKQAELVRQLHSAGPEGMPVRDVDGRLVVGDFSQLVTGTMRKHTPPRLKLTALGRAVALRFLEKA